MIQISFFPDREKPVDLDWKGSQVFEYKVCTQGISRCAGVAVWNQNYWDANRLRRSDVGTGVANHDAFLRSDTQLLHGGLQGQGEWFLLCC